MHLMQFIYFSLPGKCALPSKLSTDYHKLDGAKT